MSASSLIMSKPGILVLSLLGLMLVGLIDFLTGAELSFSIFYLLPILAATWYVGRAGGFFLGFLGAATWIVSDIFTHNAYSYFLIPYWNGFVRLSFFLIITYFASVAKTGWELEKSVSRTDSLTGVKNARAFFEIAELELERTARDGTTLSLAYIDLDNFKRVNDTRGHDTGDRLLKRVAEIMLNSLRKVDTAARMGGDEFVALLPGTDEKRAMVVLGRVRENLLAAMRESDWPVTFSIGIATFLKPPVSVQAMIKTADNIMYEIKNSGKDRIWGRCI